MDSLSPLNYTIQICQISHAKAFFSVCTTTLLLLFGDDYTALLIATIMLALDTVTGTVAALIHNEFNSSGIWRFIPKAIAIVSAFMVGNMLVVFQPEIGTALEYGIISMIIFAESVSVLENVAKISPEFDFRQIIKKLKK